MKERPILFITAMVRALLDGRKTQTRRIVSADVAEALDFLGGGADGEPATGEDVDIRWGQADDGGGKIGKPQWLASCADYPEEGVIEIGAGYGQPGDRLYVKEACWIWGRWTRNGLTKNGRQKWRFRSTGEHRVIYEKPGTTTKRSAPEGSDGPTGWVYRHARFMPRWASRILLEITNVRVERVQEISNDDALAEGINRPIDMRYPVDEFRALWDSINAARGFGWDKNDWVMVIGFKRIET